MVGIATAYAVLLGVVHAVPRYDAVVFPLAARGKQAVAQGKVEDLEMSRAKYVNYRQHAAKETGEKFDEASLSGDGPFHVYQIAGTGAEICK